MNWEDREKEELRLDEGVRLKAYKDKYGNWTIGVGHLLGKDPVFASLVWTEDQVELTFEEDFQKKIEDTFDRCPVIQGLDGPRKGALVNMAFNMGADTLSTFHAFLDLLDQGRYADAADDLLITLYAKQLPERVGRLAYRIRTGAYADR